MTRLIETLNPDDHTAEVPELVSTSRTFRGGPRDTVVVSNFIDMFRLCTICGGRFYPSDSTQIDHIVQHAAGGPTTPSNARETHPFCNNQRDTIESIKAGKEKIELPQFEDPRKLTKPEQLSFLSFIVEPDNEEPEDSFLGDEDMGARDNMLTAGIEADDTANPSDS